MLRVCRIGRAQGLKGEVNVRSFTDDPLTRFAAGSILIDRNGQKYTVKHSRNFKSRWIILFEGIEDRNASEALNGTDLFIDESELGVKSEDAWYPDDLIGLEVLAVDDHEAALEADYDGVDAHLIGTISAVTDNTAQTLIEIKLSDTGKTALIPFVEQIVPIVDIDEQYILVDPPAGLLEL